MSPRIAKLWTHLWSSLWFRPFLFVSAGIALGVVLPALERSGPGLGRVLRGFWLEEYIPSTASSSREVLIAMAAALATIVAVAASMTMVTVQLAASQYTPRLLRRFLSDPITQRMLGIFLAAASQPRVLIRFLEVLAQLASVEEREPLRLALVRCGREVYQASRLARERERDAQRILEHWQQLQRMGQHPEELPAPPIHRGGPGPPGTGYLLIAWLEVLDVGPVAVRPRL
ncbi:MAG: DUF2254 domain-containing protein [Myxococcaceae bacterium]|nr:DUF2254 domain-containing protein [Myxococcaceae bacterium]